MINQGDGRQPDVTGVDQARAAIDERLSAVEHQVEQTVKDTVDTATGAVHQLRDHIQGRADQLMDRAGRYWGDMEESMVQQARVHPWLVLGIVMLVGAVISRMAGSSRARDRSY
jgi:hypothetical protein